MSREEKIKEAINNSERYTKHYSEEGFWEKLKKYAKKIGRELVIQALTLYYIAIDSDTPVWARTAIFGALGYFILPIDIIPDVIPVVGFTDDALVLAAALKAVVSYRKKEHVEAAEDKVSQWFD